jgi:hypothetical protein
LGLGIIGITYHHAFNFQRNIFTKLEKIGRDKKSQGSARRKEQKEPTEKKRNE